MDALHRARLTKAEVGMVALSTIPIQVSEEAAQYIEQMGLQEPFQRILNEVPKRIQTIQWIKVVLEHIVDEANRPVITIHVARVDPGCADPSGREFGYWETETFPPEILEHLGVNVTYVEAHAG
jgi:hypothetical protein